MRILISSSMKVYSQLPEIVASLEKHGHSVRMPEPGGGGVGVDFKRRMIENLTMPRICWRLGLLS